MTLYVWPWRLLAARVVKVLPAGQVLRGGRSLSGQEQVGAITGGGRWAVGLGGITLRTPDQVRCARAWSAHLQGGLIECVVPLFDLGRAPRPWQGGRPAIGGPPAPSNDYFAQAPGFGSTLIAAEVSANAALRATTLGITISRGVEIRGGEHFSINHGTWGWRLYRVGRVTAAGGATYSCEVWPPLREAVAAGVAVEFDVPRITARLDPDRAAELEPELSLNRVGEVSANFLESF